MIIKENGTERTVSKSQAVDLRLIDNATRKGDNKAIEMVDQRRRRIAEAQDNNRRYHTLSDEEILSAYFRQLAADSALDGGLLGDPEPSPDDVPSRPSDQDQRQERHDG